MTKHVPNKQVISIVSWQMMELPVQDLQLPTVQRLVNVAVLDRLHSLLRIVNLHLGVLSNVSRYSYPMILPDQHSTYRHDLLRLGCSCRNVARCSSLSQLRSLTNGNTGRNGEQPLNESLASKQDFPTIGIEGGCASQLPAVVS